ncbi:MAG TPA: hypothetical protein VI564_07805 [Candidatus Nanoarchaeia archaeon]|nr:hypothetical protein [Candidatus Nanoarchaeia archaeon]
MSNQTTLSIRSEVINLLEPIFGAEFIQGITGMYEESDSNEIIKLAEKMLKDYLGGEEGGKIINNLLKKHPEYQTK